ncbi:MAG TPA: response regulator transcription factor [Luteibacter sp.]|jgi:two-component system capsular synthesis response regulator RcsB|uniref:response regulator transcription factor n=1 Tax=Luteibacter sp. TaxID=1886636 RepID=UPI002F414194
MIRAIVADDHPVVRLGLRLAMQKAADMRVVAEADTAEALLAAVKDTPCDVVVTDFSMPGGNRGDGLGLLGTLVRTAPDTPVVLVTVLDFPDVLRAVLALGIHGLCNKTDPLEQVVEAVRVVVAGGTYISAGLQDVLQDTPSPSTATSLLTVREAEVLRLLGEGLTGNEIAARLNRSPKTISRQKSDVMAKLGLEGDAALAAFLRAHHLG